MAHTHLSAHRTLVRAMRAACVHCLPVGMRPMSCVLDVPDEPPPAQLRALAARQPCDPGARAGPGCSSDQAVSRVAPTLLETKRIQAESALRAAARGGAEGKENVSPAGAAAGTKRSLHPRSPLMQNDDRSGGVSPLMRLVRVALPPSPLGLMR